MKQCSKCEIKKSPAEFYSVGAQCKDCIKKRVKDRYYRDTAKIAEYEKSRANMPHRVKLRADYLKTPEGVEKSNKAKYAYIARNPDKRAAHNALNNAIRDGSIQRKPCEKCGSHEVHGHHDDYSKPLVVRWLCPKHHREAHQNVE